MPVKKPTQKAYLGTFATSIFIQGCTVLQGVLLARLLGPAGRGDFAVIILWPSIFAGFGIFGVNMAIARFAGRGLSADNLVKTAVKASLLTGFVAALICGLSLPFLLPADKHSLLPLAYLFLLFIPINHFALNLQGVDQGAGNFTWLNTTRALLYPVFFGGILLSWWFATDKLFWVAVSLLAANGSVVLLRLLVKRGCFGVAGPGVGARWLLKESLPFVTASFIAILYMQMDKALLVWLLAPEEIGWYVAAFAAAGSVNVLSTSLGLVQFSSSAQAKPGYGFSTLGVVLRRGGVVSFVGGFALALVLPWLLPLVYGEEFYPALKIAYILLPGLVLAGLGNVINQALAGQGKPISGVVSKILGLCVMGGVGALLAGELGGRGIAFGYLAGEAVASLGLLAVTFKFYRDASVRELLPVFSDFNFFWMKIRHFLKLFRV